MNSEQLEHLLRQASIGPRRSLPTGFAANAIRSAKVRASATRVQQRLLSISGAAALALSLAIGLGMAHSVDSLPPSLSLFQPGACSQPFTLP